MRDLELDLRFRFYSEAENSLKTTFQLIIQAPVFGKNGEIIFLIIKSNRRDVLFLNKTLLGSIQHLATEIHTLPKVTNCIVQMLDIGSSSIFNSIMRLDKFYIALQVKYMCMVQRNQLRLYLNDFHLEDHSFP